jgi:hypothetical protein
VLPIATAGRADGGTDYYMEPEAANLFAAARDQPPAAAGSGRRRGTPQQHRPVPSLIADRAYLRSQR